MSNIKQLYPEDIIVFQHPELGTLEGVIYMLTPDSHMQVLVEGHGTLLVPTSCVTLVKESFFSSLFSSETKEQLAAMVEKGKSMVRIGVEKKTRKKKEVSSEEVAKPVTVVEDF